MQTWASHKHTWNERLSQFGHYVKAHLNFFRIHVLFFTFTPLIVSGIFYASNGSTHISYIDSLFQCVTAITVCGLTTVDLSSLTPWQQVLLFLQMCAGSPVVVSWVMVYVRRKIFANQFRTMLEQEIARRVEEKVNAPVEVRILPWWKRAARLFVKPSLSTIQESTQSAENGQLDRGRSSRVRPEMIRRMNDAPKLINPSGFISEGHPQQSMANGAGHPEEKQLSSAARSISDATDLEVNRELDSELESEDSVGLAKRTRHDSLETPNGFSTPAYDRPLFSRLRAQHGGVDAMPRTQTIEFAPNPRTDRDQDKLGDVRHEIGSPFLANSPRNRRMSLPRQPSMPRTVTMPRTITIPRTMTVPRTGTIPRSGTLPWTETNHTFRTTRTKHRGFGGFPMPHEIVSRGFNYFFPNLKRTLTRTVTIPRTQTIASQRVGPVPGAKPVTYISFEAIVGRNSDFGELSREQLEELGGVEYRSLTALLWIVGGYHIGTQLLAFIVIAPYMSIQRWRLDFLPPVLHKPVTSTWFSLFQVVSAYTNTGMSLQDQSMVPFQQAYLMIVFMIFLILAGNTAFPIFLRFLIWTLSKIAPKNSRMNETLHFLLDHPRRCFIYLFPSHQTWFLLTVVLSLTVTDWFFFLVLDIGTSAIAAIPTGVRVIIGLLQATAVRSAGFGTVALSALAPAVKVLYVLMMYISVYPIAMSVRSTNVYEEQSLGVFEEDNESFETQFKSNGARATIWSRYLAMHMRRQLSFDMWWLGLALFLVCIIERDNLDNDALATWFNIFNILFELVSAYGTVGLSLGIPYANYSFSGALRPLSKLIVCVVMLRGRHRGLPVAIDRAVILPFEFRNSEDRTDIGADPSGRDSSEQPHAHDTASEKGRQQDMQRRSWRSGSVDSGTARQSIHPSDSEV